MAAWEILLQGMAVICLQFSKLSKSTNIERCEDLFQRLAMYPGRQNGATQNGGAAHPGLGCAPPNLGTLSMLNGAHMGTPVDRGTPLPEQHFCPETAATAKGNDYGILPTGDWVCPVRDCGHVNFKRKVFPKLFPKIRVGGSSIRTSTRRIIDQTTKTIVFGVSVFVLFRRLLRV